MVLNEQTIPIRNVWWLLWYASELAIEPDYAPHDIENAIDRLPHILIELFLPELARKLRRPLAVEHLPRQAASAQVRGRIQVLPTLVQQRLLRGQVVCQFSALDYDTAFHRLLLAAVQQAGAWASYPSQQQQCRRLAQQLHGFGVTALSPSQALATVSRLGKLREATDRRLMLIAKLLLRLGLPHPALNSAQLPSPIQDPTSLRRLFEKAVAGFYRVVLDPQQWKVKTGQHWHWPVEAQSSGITTILPRMKTDIVLEHTTPAHRIVIDTKLTALLRSGWYRERTLHSPYLYQLYAYLRTQEGRGDPLADTATGVLLHPVVAETVDEWLVLHGHCLRFKTVDLSQSLAEMRAQLLAICQIAMPF